MVVTPNMIQVWIGVAAKSTRTMERCSIGVMGRIEASMATLARSFKFGRNSDLAVWAIFRNKATGTLAVKKNTCRNQIRSSFDQILRS